MSEHTYPPAYRPSGKDTDMDRAWETLDILEPGVIPDDVRFWLAGAIVGMLSRAREEERQAKHMLVEKLLLDGKQQNVATP